MKPGLKKTAEELRRMGEQGTREEQLYYTALRRVLVGGGGIDIPREEAEQLKQELDRIDAIKIIQRYQIPASSP